MGQEPVVKETEDLIVVYIERKPFRRNAGTSLGQGPLSITPSILYLLLKSMGSLNPYRCKREETNGLYQDPEWK